jgi:FkbM family methyltransferase
MLKKLFSKVIYLIKLYLIRDKDTNEFNRWFNDNGDTELRLNYPELNSNSVVFDLGGFEGDFAHEIFQKYNCNIFIFEPHPEFYLKCKKRFKKNKKIHIYNYGLSDKNITLDLVDDSNRSSTEVNHLNNTKKISCMFKSFDYVLDKVNVKLIDLMKINIEGGEYQLLNSMILNGQLEMVLNYQIQFHKFIPNAITKRNLITKALSQKFVRTWCYDFVWENWEKNND